MRGDELLDILEHIDPDLIEAAHRKPKNHWLRWTAVAACFALLITLAALPRRPANSPGPTVVTTTPTGEPTVPTTPDSPTDRVPLANYANEPEKLTGLQIIGNPSNNVSNPGSGIRDEFSPYLVVEARVTQVLPDLYCHPIYGTKYRILKLEILDVINGQFMPDSIYLRLNPSFSTDLGRFDSLIITMEQVGINNIILKNADQNTMESFLTLFEPYYKSSTRLAVVAFTNGVMDASLWNLDGWELPSYRKDDILSSEGYAKYPAKIGSTVEETKDAIGALISQKQGLSSLKVRTQDILPEDPVFDYVAPFQNGVFTYTYYSRTSIRYTRLINGFESSECICVTDNGVTYEGEAFTEEDLSKMPDLSFLLERLDLETLTPPHMESIQGLTRSHLGAKGQYVKMNGQIYGIVKVNWEFNNWEDRIAYYDALFYLVHTDGSYHQATRSEMESIIGVDLFESDVPYAKGILIPQI